MTGADVRTFAAAGAQFRMNHRHPVDDLDRSKRTYPGAAAKSQTAVTAGGGAAGNQIGGIAILNTVIIDLFSAEVGKTGDYRLFHLHGAGIDTQRIGDGRALFITGNRAISRSDFSDGEGVGEIRTSGFAAAAAVGTGKQFQSQLGAGIFFNFENFYENTDDTTQNNSEQSHNHKSSIQRHT